MDIVEEETALGERLCILMKLMEKLGIREQQVRQEVNTIHVRLNEIYKIKKYGKS